MHHVQYTSQSSDGNSYKKIQTTSHLKNSLTHGMADVVYGMFRNLEEIKGDEVVGSW